VKTYHIDHVSWQCHTLQIGPLSLHWHTGYGGVPGHPKLRRFPWFLWFRPRGIVLGKASYATLFEGDNR
jgi:hypothetical protein